MSGERKPKITIYLQTIPSWQKRKKPPRFPVHHHTTALPVDHFTVLQSACNTPL